jgi:hypothetical protein
MRGFKAFHSAQVTLAGLSYTTCSGKDNITSPLTTIFEQFYGLAA